MCVRLCVCVFTSSSSMSACFTVTGSSWLIKSDIIVRLLRTTPSSAFSFFTWNINSTYWINTGTVTRWKEEGGKYWFYKGWKRKRIKKHSYKKEFCDSIVTNIEKPVSEKHSAIIIRVSPFPVPSPGCESRHCFPQGPVLDQRSEVGWAVWKTGVQQAE